MKKTVFLFLALRIFKVEAQTPVVVTPFPFSGYGMSTNGFAHLTNGTIFWTATNNSMWELWRSDGTQQGTIKLKDFPTPISLEDNNIDTRVVNNTLFFVANDNVHGNELWKSDGTIQGTTMVADINVGSGSSNIIGATNANGIFYFVAFDGIRRNLYKISDSPVPVELITFAAKPTNNKVQLDWKTAAEINTLGFDIEHSIDGQTWSKLGFVGAKNLPSEYQYFDQMPKLNQVNYYRLCTVDIDGKKEFSKIESVKFNEIRSPIKIYPSVTEGVINIETALNIQQVWVSNASGQIVLTSTQSSLNLGSFPTGVYVVTVKGGDSIFSETVFKQ